MRWSDRIGGSVGVFGLQRALVALVVILVCGAAGPPSAYRFQVTQVDASGTALGPPVAAPCDPAGCQFALPLRIGGDTHRFAVSVTFVERGAYLAIEASDPGLGQVFDFEQGFNGPLFVPTRASRVSRSVLRLIVEGAGGEAGSPGTITRGPVFGRKTEPDAVLRIEVTAPANP